MLLVSTTGYTGEAFRDAARALEVPTLVGSDRCHVLAEQWPLEGMVTLDFRHAETAVEKILEVARGDRQLGGIVATSETTARIAAIASGKLGLRHNPPAATEATANKRIMRQLLEQAGVPAPRARADGRRGGHGQRSGPRRAAHGHARSVASAPPCGDGGG